MLSNKQKWLYFGLWKAAKKELMHGRETWTGEEENRRRHEIHVRALGHDKSSKDFTNADLDKVIAELKAIIDPSDLNAQLRQQDMQTRRMLFGLRSIMRELGVDSVYVAGIIKRMNAEGALASNRLDNLGTDDLRKVMIALRKHKHRGGGTIGEDSAALARNYELRPS